LMTPPFERAIQFEGSILQHCNWIKHRISRRNFFIV
jgi:hypothetical protein